MVQLQDGRGVEPEVLAVERTRPAAPGELFAKRLPAATQPGPSRTLGERLARPFALARMGWNSVLRHSVCESQPRWPAVPLPPLDQRLMRLVLLLRGLHDDNDVGRRTLVACARRALEHLERTARPAEPEPLAVHTWGPRSEATLYDEFVRTQRPVVIRGLPAEMWRWTVDWLVGKHGHVSATLVDKDSASHAGRRIRDLETTAPNGGPLYLHNHFQVFQESPEELDAVPLELLSRIVRRPVPKTTALFASVREGTGSVLHCANNYNTFFMLDGRKRWVLIDPGHLLLVYPILSNSNFYQLSLVRREEDVETLPLYRYCPRYVIDLDPGDCLLVPTWWYHSVRNLCARTLACAVRWPAFLPGETCTNFLYRFLVEIAPRHPPGARPIHQEGVSDVGTGAARRAWGLTG